MRAEPRLYLNASVRVAYFLQKNTKAELGPMARSTVEYVIIVHPSPYVQFPGPCVNGVHDFMLYSDTMTAGCCFWAEVKPNKFEIRLIARVAEAEIVWNPFRKISKICVISSINRGGVSPVLVNRRNIPAVRPNNPMDIPQEYIGSIADNQRMTREGQSSRNIDHADDRYSDGSKSGQQHCKGPLRHFLLSFQIVGGSFGLLIDLHGLRKTSDSFGKGRLILSAKANFDGLLYIAVLVLGSAHALLGMLSLVFPSVTSPKQRKQKRQGLVSQEQSIAADRV